MFVWCVGCAPGFTNRCSLCVCLYVLVCCVIVSVCCFVVLLLCCLFASVVACSRVIVLNFVVVGGVVFVCFLFT